MLEREMMNLLDVCYDKALQGVLPGEKSIEELAEDYLYKSSSKKKAIDDLIGYQTLLCGTNGFITGLGGLLVLPVAIPTNILSTIYIQLRMIAAIAYINGYDIYSDQVRTIAYACLTGSSATKVLKNVGIKVNIKVVENLDEIEKNGQFDLLFQNWQTVSTGDSQWFLDNAFKTGGSANYGKYSNKELDDLINKLTTTFDVKERQKITKEASQIIIDEAYGTYIVSQANVNVSNNKVENMHNFPIDYYFLTADTKITK